MMIFVFFSLSVFLSSCVPLLSYRSLLFYLFIYLLTRIGAKLNIPDKEGRLALHLAASAGVVDLVKGGESSFVC
jgi:ankyrin repeat protein